VVSVTEQVPTKCVPLESGDRLTRAEFERRYSARPDIKKAELIEGLVYVASPVRTEEHGQPHFDVGAWLGAYVAKTPGIIRAVDSTVKLDPDNEFQPDLFLAWDPAHGGAATLEDGYFIGAPDLAVEISASTAARDLSLKMDVYRRNGVREYLVWQIYEERIDWFALDADGVYQAMEADEGGVIVSRVFPGLRLDVAAMLRGDLAAVLGALG
jgi:Uma2 family endonuclease